MITSTIDILTDPDSYRENRSFVILSDERSEESKDASDQPSLHLEGAMSDPNAWRSTNGESRDLNTDEQDFSSRPFDMLRASLLTPPPLEFNCVQIALIPRLRYTSLGMTM